MAEQEAKEDQVASSMTPWEINNKLILEHSRDIMSEMILSSNQNEAECHEVMFIPETTATYVIGGAECASVTTWPVLCGDNALICYGGATSTLTRSFDNCMQI
jgi:uncharacterized protein YjlB